MVNKMKLQILCRMNVESFIVCVPIAVEHIWYHVHKDEEIRPGDLIIYWIRVENEAGLWYQSVQHTARVGQEAPSSDRLRI